MLHCVALCCNLLKCVTVCCSVLQCLRVVYSCNTESSVPHVKKLPCHVTYVEVDREKECILFMIVMIYDLGLHFNETPHVLRLASSPPPLLHLIPQIHNFAMLDVCVCDYK